MKIIKAIILFFKNLFSKKRISAVAQSIVPPKFKFVIGELVSVCPGGRHAWYQSNVGKIRKPLIGNLKENEN